MSSLPKIFLLSLLIITIYFIRAVADYGDPEIHPFIKSETYCTGCHGQDGKSKFGSLNNICSQQCLACHKDMKEHHPINIKIQEKLPDEYVLTEKKRLTCSTCHNTKIDRFDNISWKAESLFERVFKGEKKYKTYFLVKRNNEGQLCKICH